MSYTEMYMLAFSPDDGSLPSIGSVAGHIDNEYDSLVDSIASTPEAASIRATFGEAAYQCYLERQANLRRARMADRQKARKCFWERKGTELKGRTSTALKASKWATKILNSIKAPCL